MTFLSSLQSLCGSSLPGGTLDEARWAQLPFYLMAHGATPFEESRGPGHQVPGQLAVLWRQAVASYQLCTFHAVNATVRGHVFAERVLGEQARFLDGLEPGLGAAHEREMRKLYDFASRPMEITTRDGRLLEIPVDWRIAVDFLLTSPASPFRSEQATFSAEGAPSFPGAVDALLAEALERAWDRAATHFQALVEGVD